MKIIGLTGSIGMGKSEAARMLKMLRVPVFEADAAVHKLLAKNGEAVPLVAKQFPDCVSDGEVNRQALGRKVFHDAKLRNQLEAIMHPLVQREEQRFIAHMKKHGKHVVVLDIPLLFETGGDARCDAVMVVTAPHYLQRQRVLKRPNMTEEIFQAILKTQMPDREKRRRADVVIHTGLGKRRALCEIASALYETNRT